MSHLLTTFGMAVRAQAENIPAPPEFVEMVRTCEPSPALVKLLADTATAWAKQGRIDDACAALSLALCARSAAVAVRPANYSDLLETQS